MSAYSIGTAHRTPVQRTPVIHMLVQENGDWRMWCSYGKGREDNPHGNRFCPKCKTLVADAINDGTMDPSEAGRFAP